MAVGDFERDSRVTRTGLKAGGPPLPGHVRRCQAKKRNGTGEQCAQWALKGQDYCRIHGGRRKARSQHFGGRMKGFYSKHATGRLKDMIEEAASIENRIDLAGEVDAARAFCLEAVKVCSLVLDPPKGVEISDTMKLSAVQIAQNSVEHVSKVVERMVKVMALSDSTFNAIQVDNICTTIINLLMKHLEDQPEVMDLIVKDIESIKTVKKADVQIHIK